MFFFFFLKVLLKALSEIFFERLEKKAKEKKIPIKKKKKNKI